MAEHPVTEAPVLVIPSTAPAVAAIAGPTDVAIMPTTTAQQNLIKQSQIAIDRLWERTQTFIACVMAVTVAALCIILVLKEKIDVAIGLIGPLAGVIFNSYFTRTNHVKTGGVAENQQGR